MGLDQGMMVYIAGAQTDKGTVRMRFVNPFVSDHVYETEACEQ